MLTNEFLSFEYKFRDSCIVPSNRHLGVHFHSFLYENSAHLHSIIFITHYAGKGLAEAIKLLKHVVKLELYSQKLCI